MPIIGAGIMAGGSMIGGGKASKGAAAAGEAESKVAQEGLDFAKQVYQNQLDTQTKLLGMVQSASTPPPQELQAVSQILSNSSNSLSAQLQAIQQGYKTLDSVDPALKVAGNNAYNLMNGQASTMLKPLQAQLDNQKTQLQQELSSKLGPGWQTSAAGIMAMNNFNLNSASTLNSAQFQATTQAIQATSSLGGLSGQVHSALEQETGSAYAASSQGNATASQILQTRSQQGLQAAGVYSGATPGGQTASGAYNSLSSVVGNQYAGQIAQGQNMANLFGNIGGATMMAGMSQGNVGTPNLSPGYNNTGGSPNMTLNDFNGASGTPYMGDGGTNATMGNFSNPTNSPLMMPS